MIENCVDSIELREPEGGARPYPHSRRTRPTKTFTLDRVFGPNAVQEDVYEHVKPLVQSAVDGYNATVFAYGHTGSGKTHTMTGSSFKPGVTPRAVRDLFAAIQRVTRVKDVVFLVHVSYVELYNNQFRNLLEDIEPCVSSKSKIEIHESRDTGVFLTGPPTLKVAVTSERDVKNVVAFGDKVRAYASTRCNHHSSRSHCILTLHVQSRWSDTSAVALRAASSSVRVGKLNLVDLAGSERVSLSGAEGETLVEAQNINLSLTLLGDVFAALSRNAVRREHGAASRARNCLEPIPYRNSKLTHLLKDSIGGNSKTLMVATLRGAAEYYRQSLVTLMYASRARTIKNRSTVNLDLGSEPRTTNSLRVVSDQLNVLHARLRAREREFDMLCARSASSTSENANLKAQLQRLEALNEEERRQLELKLNTVIHGHSSELRSRTEQFGKLQTRLQERILNYRETCAKQEEEINFLRNERVILERHVFNVGATQREIREMHVVMAAWQAQAVALQAELKYHTEFRQNTHAQSAPPAQKIMGLKKYTINSTGHQTMSSELSRAVFRISVLERMVLSTFKGFNAILEDSHNSEDSLIQQFETPTPTQHSLLRTASGRTWRARHNNGCHVTGIGKKDYEYRVAKSERGQHIVKARLVETEHRLEAFLLRAEKRYSEELATRHKLLLSENARSTFISALEKTHKSSLRTAQKNAKRATRSFWASRASAVGAALEQRETHEIAEVRALKSSLAKSLQAQTDSAQECTQKTFQDKLINRRAQEVHRGHIDNSDHRAGSTGQAVVEPSAYCATAYTSSSMVPATEMPGEFTPPIVTFAPTSTAGRIVLRRRKHQKLKQTHELLDRLKTSLFENFGQYACESTRAIQLEQVRAHRDIADIRSACIAEIWALEQRHHERPVALKIKTSTDQHQRQRTSLEHTNISVKPTLHTICKNQERAIFGLQRKQGSVQPWLGWNFNADLAWHQDVTEDTLCKLAKLQTDVIKFYDRVKGKSESVHSGILKTLKGNVDAAQKSLGHAQAQARLWRKHLVCSTAARQLKEDHAEEIFSRHAGQRKVLWRKEFQRKLVRAEALLCDVAAVRKYHTAALKSQLRQDTAAPLEGHRMNQTQAACIATLTRPYKQRLYRSTDCIFAIAAFASFRTKSAMFIAQAAHLAAAIANVMLTETQGLLKRRLRVEKFERRNSLLLLQLDLERSVRCNAQRFARWHTVKINAAASKRESLYAIHPDLARALNLEHGETTGDADSLKRSIRPFSTVAYPRFQLVANLRIFRVAHAHTFDANRASQTTQLREVADAADCQAMVRACRSFHIDSCAEIDRAIEQSEHNRCAATSNFQSQAMVWLDQQLQMTMSVPEAFYQQRASEDKIEGQHFGKDPRSELGTLHKLGPQRHSALATQSAIERRTQTITATSSQIKRSQERQGVLRLADAKCRPLQTAITAGIRFGSSYLKSLLRDAAIRRGALSKSMKIKADIERDRGISICSTLIDHAPLKRERIHSNSLVERLQRHDAGFKNFPQCCDQTYAIHLDNVLRRQKQAYGKQFDALKKKTLRFVERVIIAATGFHENAWRCFRSLVSAAVRSRCGVPSAHGSVTSLLPPEVEADRYSFKESRLNFTALGRLLARHETQLATCLEKTLRRRDANSTAALRAALHRANLRHFRRLNVIVQLRDTYWQELLGAALQENDSIHATLNQSQSNTSNHRSSNEDINDRRHGASEIQKLKFQLECERKARWDILSGATKRPSSRTIIGCLDDVAAHIVACCIAGDAYAVERVFDENKLGGFESDEAKRRKCSTVLLLPIHRALSGFEYHSDSNRLLDTLKCLVGLGADVTHVDANGDTALHRALATCPANVALDVCEYLLSCGVDPETRNLSGDSSLNFATALLSSERGADGPYTQICRRLGSWPLECALPQKKCVAAAARVARGHDRRSDDSLSA